MMWVVGDPLPQIQQMRAHLVEFNLGLGYAEAKQTSQLADVFGALTGSGGRPEETLDPALVASSSFLPIRVAWLACHCMLGSYPQPSTRLLALHREREARASLSRAAQVYEAWGATAAAARLRNSRSEASERASAKSSSR
jgi:hypothetical protein